MPNAAPDAAQRFTADLHRLTGGAGRLGIAVSGGPDSMALLLLAHLALPGRVEAATVDHGLRPESAREAAMVASWCVGHDIPHATLRPATPIVGSLQSAARAARYALLEQWRQRRGIDWIATAHHADDQLETLLMRLNRGSGVAGLSGIRARNGAIVRPLLGWRKDALEALAAAHGMPFVHDPSNSDGRFDRAALRASLRGADWLDAVAAVRSATALAQAEDALQWMVEDLAHRHIRVEGAVWRLDRTDFPREIQRRLLLHMLRAADPAAPAPRGDTIDTALQSLAAGQRASIGAWLAEGGTTWTLRPAPPRRDARDR